MVLKIGSTYGDERTRHCLDDTDDGPDHKCGQLVFQGCHVVCPVRACVFY